MGLKTFENRGLNMGFFCEGMKLRNIESESFNGNTKLIGYLRLESTEM
jgi:hypothetical protein